MLISVAHRAVAEGAVRNRRLMIDRIERDLIFGDPGGEDAGSGLPAATVEGGDRKAAILDRKIDDLGFVDLRAIFARVLRHSRDQIGPGDPLRKAGRVTGQRDAQGARRAVVEHQCPPAISRHVQGGAQPGGSRANYDAIPNLAHGAPTHGPQERHRFLRE